MTKSLPKCRALLAILGGGALFASLLSFAMVEPAAATAVPVHQYNMCTRLCRNRNNAATRLHSSIGYLPPTEFEAEHYRHINTQQQPLLGEPSLH